MPAIVDKDQKNRPIEALAAQLPHSSAHLRGFVMVRLLQKCFLS